MRPRLLALVVLALLAAAGLALWRRRSGGVQELTLQLGLADGSVHTLEITDPATAELQKLAAGVRDSLTGGA